MMIASDVIKGILVFLGWTVIGYLGLLPPGLSTARRHLLEDIHFWISVSFIVGFAGLLILEVVVIRIDRIRTRGAADVARHQ